MKINTIKAVLLFLLAGQFQQLIAQQNIFLNRSYWKTNPSIESIEENIKKGNDIAALNPHAMDGVTYAILEKVDNKTIKHLLAKKGNGVNKLTHDARTYVFWAAYKNNPSLMKYLFEKGANPKILDKHGYTISNFAAATGQQNKEIYELCAANGVAVNATNENGASALLLLSSGLKDFKMLDYFAKMGMRIDSKDKDGNNIFVYAARGGNIPLMNELIKRGIEHSNPNAMLFASRGRRRNPNTLETFKYLAGKGVKVNVSDKSNRTPLHNLAFSSNDEKVYRYFITNGVAVAQKDNEGNTALLNAAYGRKVPVLQLLADSKSNINVQNKKGESALLRAFRYNTPEAVAFLLQKGADINVVDKDKHNVLYYTINGYRANAKKRFEEKLALLKKYNFNIKQSFADGSTLFHEAVKKNNLALVKRIHDLGVDVNQANKEGITPLHQAAMLAKDNKILKYLVSIGANTNAKTVLEETALDLAKENEILNKKNADYSFLK